MLNWDDYNESDKVQKPQKIQETQPVIAEEKVEAVEENISEYSPVEAGDRAKQAQEAIDKLDTRQGEEELEGLAGSCLLYTSPSPRDYAASRMPSSA